MQGSRESRRVWYVTLVALALALSCLAQAGRARAATMTLQPVADAWVSSDAPDANHGSDAALQLGGYLAPDVPDKRAYIRFEATVPADAVVTRTTLRIYMDFAPPGGFQLRFTNPPTWPWDESALTWNTPPPSYTGPVSGATGNVITQGWNDISVPFLPPTGAITYLLTRNGTETAAVQSKEGANEPRLIVEYEVPDTAPTSVCSATGCIESTPWTTTTSWAVAVADFNGDGLDDHFVGRHGAGERIYLQQGDGSFAPGFQFPAADRHGCTAGDVNGDSRMDLYCMQGADGGDGLGEKHNELWLSRSDGTYVDRAADWGVTDVNGRGRRPLLFDFSDDGRPDLYITNFAPGNGASANKLFINTGATFVEKVVSATGDFGSACVDDGDWDHDASHLRDFLVCGTELNLFHNSGPAHETEQRNGALGTPVSFPTDAKLADVNGDGWDDLVVITRSKLQIRLNAACQACNRFAQVSFQEPLVDGTSLAVDDLTGDGRPDVYVVEGVDQAADASGPRNAPDRLFAGPNWTPVVIPQTEIGTGDDSEFINVDGHPTLIVTNGRSFSRGPVQFIAFRPNAYPRPKAASPMRVSLVPAYQVCTTPNQTHGGPLASPSCNPPVELSTDLSVGTSDANGAAAQAAGFVQLKAKIGASPAPSDVLMAARITDVRCKPGVSTCGPANVSAGLDYTGEVQATLQLRVTDRFNGTSGTEPATAEITFPVSVPCAPTSDTTSGGTCEISTSANALLPDSVQAGNRTIWQVGQVQVTDGGEDGLASTRTDNTLFMKQGIFLP